MIMFSQTSVPHFTYFYKTSKKLARGVLESFGIHKVAEQKCRARKMVQIAPIESFWDALRCKLWRKNVSEQKSRAHKMVQNAPTESF